MPQIQTVVTQYSILSKFEAGKAKMIASQADGMEAPRATKKIILLVLTKCSWPLALIA